MKKKVVAPFNGARVNDKVVEAITSFNMAVIAMEAAKQLREDARGRKLSARQRSFVAAANNSFERAQKALNELLGVIDNASVTSTATPTTHTHNRVPFVAPEMEFDWDEVEEMIVSSDDKARKARWIRSSGVERPNCRCCRRRKASINSNSRPSKDRK